MKKKLSYRDKLLELAYIYSVKEIQEYVTHQKNLTTGQLELILKKNNITIPKDFKTSFIKENFIKPISKIKSNINDFKESQIKAKNKFLRKTENFKFDTQRKISGRLRNLWKNLGTIGLNFLNIIPILGKTFYNFFAKLLTELFSGLYNQQINPKNARTAVIGFFVIVGVTTLIITGLTKYDNINQIKKVEIEKPEVKEQIKEIKPKTQVKKKEIKPKTQVKKEKKEPELKVKKNSVAEVILPDLNLKTQTVLNLFKDVDYDLG